MATLELEFTVYCSCGQELAASADRWKADLIVDPCERCLAEANEEGYNKGYNKGLSDEK